MSTLSKLYTSLVTMHVTKTSDATRLQRLFSHYKVYRLQLLLQALLQAITSVVTSYYNVGTEERVRVVLINCISLIT